MTREIIRDPVYKQVTDALVDLVEADFSAGERFLTEREISNRFRVSRTTANKALSNLVMEGVLEFRKGVGTFVRRPRPNVDLRRLVSFTEKARAAGLEPTTHVISFRHTSVSEIRLLPSGDVTEALEANRTTAVYEMERLRSLDGRPVVRERRVLLADWCPGLLERDLAGSIYGLLHDRYGLSVDGIVQRIRARNAGAVDARRLGIRPGAAVLELTGVGHLEGGKPLWYETTLYRGDAYEFVNRLSAGGDMSSATFSAAAGTPRMQARGKAPWK